MAVTQVNLSDQMAVFVQKTNIISGDLGDVNQLTTATDSNAIAAINELDSAQGNIASLITNDKSNLVAAINEVKTAANNTDSSLSGFLRSNQNDVVTAGSIRFDDTIPLVIGTDSDFTLTHSAGTTTATGAITLTDSATFNNTVDINGNELILDADGDTTITADTDDQIDFKVGGSDVMVIDNSGNVGIGNSSPSHLLDATVSSGSATARFGTTHNTGVNNGTVIISNGGTGDAMLRFDYEGSNTDRARIGTTSSGQDLKFFTAGNNERMRINSSGHILVGQTSISTPGQGNTTEGGSFRGDGRVFLSANGAYSLGLNRSDTGELTNFSRQGVFRGSINVSAAGVTYNTTSDERLKENIETLENGTELLKAMRAVTYNWKADGNSDTGFIAQEMNEVMPQAVSEGDDGMLSMDYGRITPIIVAALQDALKRIDELEAKQCNCGGCS